MYKMEKLYLILGNFNVLLLTLTSIFFILIIFYSGTSYEVWGNCNAPKAITLSALIYCLRSMIGYDIPLNQVIFNFTKFKELSYIYFLLFIRVA